MNEESHRDAMNHAIRAQRQRGNVPKSMLPPEDDPSLARAAPEPRAAEPPPEPEPSPEPAANSGFLSRLLGRP